MEQQLVWGAALTSNGEGSCTCAPARLLPLGKCEAPKLLPLDLDRNNKDDVFTLHAARSCGTESL